MRQTIVLVIALTIAILVSCHGRSTETEDTISPTQVSDLTIELLSPNTARLI